MNFLVLGVNYPPLSIIRPKRFYTYPLYLTIEVDVVRRPSVKANAVLIGSSPQLVELPTRLRKLQTVSSWGRELYINLPAQNDFFIGEKMIVRIKSK